MDDLQFGIALVSALILLLGLMSHPLANRFFASQPMLALVLGFVLGPTVLHVMDAQALSAPLLEELSRIALGVGVMGIALQVPHTHLARGLVPLWILILGVMPLSALIAGFFVGWLGQVPWMVAFLIGAVLCPTDPIVASAITSSELAERSVDHEIRHLIEAESAANDGLAYPLVMVPLLLLTTQGGFTHLFVGDVMAYQVVVGGLFGSVSGIAVGFAISWLERRSLVSRDAFVSYPVAMAVAVLSFAELLHLCSVFAVFCSGVFLVLTSQERSLEVEVRARNNISMFFEIPLFFVIGLTLPWHAWLLLGWRAVAIVIAVLLLRRIPAILVFGKLIGSLRSLPDRLFVGWFGPIGLSSMYYAVFATRLFHQQSIWVFSSLVITASVLVHGLSSTWITRRYAQLRPNATRAAAASPDGPPPGGDGATAARTHR